MNSSNENPTIRCYFSNSSLILEQPTEMMTTDFNLEGLILRVDKEATEKLYLAETSIADNCSCDDCAYYTNHFIKQPFKIFQMLAEMGVDLGKNLSSEPTGVWCVRDAGEVLYIDQVYRMHGCILDGDAIAYQLYENNYKIDVKFMPHKSECINIELIFNRIVDKKG